MLQTFSNTVEEKAKWIFNKLKGANYVKYILGINYALNTPIMLISLVMQTPDGSYIDPSDSDSYLIILFSLLEKINNSDSITLVNSDYMLLFGPA